MGHAPTRARGYGGRNSATTRRSIQMRLVLFCSSVVGLLVAAVQLNSAPARDSGATAPAESGIVASDYDGDTLTLGDGRRIRLLQIDTPELGSGECYSRAARTELLRL